jgi:hypothetical protein
MTTDFGTIKNYRPFGSWNTALVFAGVATVAGYALSRFFEPIRRSLSDSLFGGANDTLANRSYYRNQRTGARMEDPDNMADPNVRRAHATASPVNIPTPVDRTTPI